jgi:peptidoglycan hydrolase CwlO-like protein
LSQPPLITSLRRLMAHLVTSLTASSDTRADIAELKELTVATKVQFETALNDLTTAVTTKVGAISDQLADLTTAFNEFKAEDTTEDAAFTARIADLETKLAAATSLTDEALVAIQSTTASVRGAASEALTEPSGSAGVS